MTAAAHSDLQRHREDARDARDPGTGSESSVSPGALLAVRLSGPAAAPRAADLWQDPAIQAAFLPRVQSAESDSKSPGNTGDQPLTVPGTGKDDGKRPRTTGDHPHSGNTGPGGGRGDGPRR